MVKPSLSAQPVEIDETVGGGEQLMDVPGDADRRNHDKEADVVLPRR